MRALLEREGLLAQRERGQNFLVDDREAATIAELAGLEADHGVLEIGTGLGILTRALAERAGRVVSVEIDAGLVRLLERHQALPAHVELVHADALELDLVGIVRDLGPRVRVVANLPYSISSPLLRRLLDLRALLECWVVMLQREVAQRLVARVGSRDYGSLAVLHQLAARVERQRDVSPRSFHPMPRVVSSVVRVTPRSDPVLRPGELERIEPWLRAAFGQRRKMLGNALRALPACPPREALHRELDALGIDRRARAESLSPELLLALARRITSPAAR